MRGCISHVHVLEDSGFMSCFFLWVCMWVNVCASVSTADTVGVKASCLLVMALLISWLLGLFWTPWSSEGANTSEGFTVSKAPVRHLAWQVCVCVHVQYVCVTVSVQKQEPCVATNQ